MGFGLCGVCHFLAVWIMGSVILGSVVGGLGGLGGLGAYFLNLAKEWHSIPAGMECTIPFRLE